MRVTVAEDSVLVRDGIVGVLTRFSHTVVDAVGDAPALLAAVRADRPDLVLTDVRMPAGPDSGLRAAVELRRADPGLPVLVLSQVVAPVAAEELLDTGDGAGVGYLLKDRVADVAGFVAAVERVGAGGTVLDPEVVARLVRRRRDPVARLSPREREVLDLMAQGRSNTEVAAALVLSDAAVHKHVRSVFTKLDLPADAPRPPPGAGGAGLAAVGGLTPAHEWPRTRRRAPPSAPRQHDHQYLSAAPPVRDRCPARQRLSAAGPATGLPATPAPPGRQGRRPTGRRPGPG